MKNCWRRRPEERPNFTQIYAELNEMNGRYSPFQPPTHQMYLPDSQEPTFSIFLKPPSTTSRQQPVAVSEPLSRQLINNLMGSVGGNSDPMSRRFSGSRTSRQVSLSFTGLTSDSSSESEDEAAVGGGSFPSTLKSRGSTIKAEKLTEVSESTATLKPSVTPQAVNRSETPDENKSAPYDSSTSTRSSIVLPAITHSLASTSNTDCSSFMSTGLESMNTTYSTPTMQPNHTSGGIEMTRLTDEKFRRDSLTATGPSSNRSSSSSNPAHSLASVSPQTVITTKSTDSGIRSDEDSSSDSQGHQLQDTHALKSSPKLRRAPPPPERSPNLRQAPPPPERSPNLRQAPPPPERSPNLRQAPPPPERSPNLRQAPPPPERSPNLRQAPPPPERSPNLRQVPPPPEKSAKLRQPPPPPQRSPKLSEEDPFEPPTLFETSFSSRDAAQKSPQPPQEDPFAGLGLGDMSSELFAAFSSISTFKQ